MSRIKEFYKKYLSWINVYWLVFIVFLIVTFTVGDSSLYKRYTYDKKIRELEKEIEHYQKEIEVNSQKLKSLHTDKEGLERFAREEYFMKKSNEDIFIIKEPLFQLQPKIFFGLCGALCWCISHLLYPPALPPLLPARVCQRGHLAGHPAQGDGLSRAVRAHVLHRGGFLHRQREREALCHSARRGRAGGLCL